MRLRPATPSDHAAITAVETAAFPTSAEAQLVHRLRADGDILIELVAEAGREVVGHIVFSRLGLEGKSDTLAGAALAPVAVRPDHQRRGIGDRLIAAGVDACRTLGLSAVVVLGHPAYYPRHGFSADAARALHDPFDAGDALMAIELTPGALGRPRRPVYARAFGL